jgi:hypothetical protein
MPKKCEYEYVIEYCKGTITPDAEAKKMLEPENVGGVLVWGEIESIDWSEDNSGNPVFPFDLTLNSLAYLDEDKAEYVRVALRKTIFDAYLHGGNDWFYAYVKDGKLPEFFENGDRIPKRFHNEIKKGKS